MAGDGLHACAAHAVRTALNLPLKWGKSTATLLAAAYQMLKTMLHIVQSHVQHLAPLHAANYTSAVTYTHFCTTPELQVMQPSEAADP
jgi:hypothetical protein